MNKAAVFRIEFDFHGRKAVMPAMVTRKMIPAPDPNVSNLLEIQKGEVLPAELKMSLASLS